MNENVVRAILLLNKVIVERVERVLRNHGDEPRLQEVPLRTLPRRRHEDDHGEQGSRSRLFKFHVDV